VSTTETQSGREAEPRPPGAQRLYRVGDLRVDLVARSVWRNGKALPVKGLSFELLACLIREHPDLASNRVINSDVWGDNFVGGSTITQRIKLLREALAGSDRYDDYIETVKSRGYRLKVPVEPIETVAKVGPGLRRRALQAIIVSLPVIAAIVWWAWPAGAPPSARDGGPETLFVLPIRNSGEDVEWAEGLRQEILDRLGTIDALTITPVRDLPAGAGADALVLESELVETGDGLELQGTLRDRRTGRILSQPRVPGAGPGPGARQATRSFAARVADDLPGRAAPGSAESNTPVDPQAYELYLRARYHGAQYARSDLNRGIRLLDRALEIEPGFARGYELRSLMYTLAGTPSYGWMSPDEAFALARRDALQALALDPRLSGANATLGNIFLWHEWNPPAAVMAYRQALELDPDSLSALLSIALLQTVTGEYDESLQTIDRAIALAPLQAGVHANAGWRLLGARRFKAALEAARRAEELDPTLRDAHEIRTWAWVYLGQTDRALQTAGEYVSDAMVGYLLAADGQEQEARERLQALLDARAETYVAPASIALVLIGLEEYDEALDWLETVVEERSREALFFRSSAIYDPLRDHPGFIDLMRRVGIWDDLPPATR